MVLAWQLQVFSCQFLAKCTRKEPEPINFVLLLGLILIKLKADR